MVMAAGGPGTELKRLLGRFRVYAEQGCKCDQRAAVMDSEGPGWCREHVDVIVGWLREEAVRRGLPFVDAAGRLLVMAAIRASEKKLRILADG